MKTLHTPGPWKVDTSKEGEPWTKLFSEKDPYQLYVAETYGDDNTEAEANAKLCAAAPDLLDACIQMARACSKYNIEVLTPEYEVMTTAINKALPDIEF